MKSRALLLCTCFTLAAVVRAGQCCLFLSRVNFAGLWHYVLILGLSSASTVINATFFYNRCYRCEQVLSPTRVLEYHTLDRHLPRKQGAGRGRERGLVNENTAGRKQHLSAGCQNQPARSHNQRPRQADKQPNTCEYTCTMICPEILHHIAAWANSKQI
jgi:hypothetical protein